jgi:hypothetical protein
MRNNIFHNVSINSYDSASNLYSTGKYACVTSNVLNYMLFENNIFNGSASNGLAFY